MDNSAVYLVRIVGIVEAVLGPVAKLDVEGLRPECKSPHGQHAVVEGKRQEGLAVGGRDTRPLLGVVDAGHLDRERVQRVIGEVEDVVDKSRAVHGQQMMNLQQQHAGIATGVDKGRRGGG